MGTKKRIIRLTEKNATYPTTTVAEFWNCSYKVPIRTFYSICPLEDLLSHRRIFGFVTIPEAMGYEVIVEV